MIILVVIIVIVKASGDCLSQQCTLYTSPQLASTVTCLTYIAFPSVSWLSFTMLRRPRVVSVEYNSNFPIAASLAMPPVSESPLDNSWNQFDLYYGSTAGSIKLMAEEAGYAVVHFVGVHDMILVRQDLLGGDCAPPYARFSRRVAAMHTCIIDETRRGKWVEYGTYLRTGGDLAQSRLAALQQVLPMTGVDAGPRSSPACLGLV